MRAPSAATARRSSAPRISRLLSSALPNRASLRSSNFASTRTRSRRPPRSRPSERRRSGQSDELGIGLVGALKAQEIVVAAVLAVGIRAAHARPRFIDGAAALFLVEEHAHGGEHRVLLVP